MKKQLLILLASAFMFTIFLVSCSPEKEIEATGEIPVTYKSEEALASYNKGLDLLDKVRFQEARNHFLAATKADPGFVQAQMNMALVANDNEEFQKHYNKLLTLKDKASDGERLMVESLEANVNNDPETAIGKATAACALYPKDKRAHLWLSGLHLNLNQHDEAIEALKKAIELDSRYVNAYNSLGYTYMNLGDYENAQKNFKMYIDLDPKEANPYDSYGDLLTKMGRFQQAVDNYKKAVVLNNNFDFSKQKEGDCYLFLGNYNKARSTYVDAAEMATTPATRIFNNYLLAESYLHEGKYNEYFSKAQEAAQMAADEKLAGLAAQIYSRKCFAYLSQGDTENAKQSIEDCKNTVLGSNLLDSQKKNWKEQNLMEEAALLAHEGQKEAAIAKLEDMKAEIELSKNPRRMYLYHLAAGYVSQVLGDHEKAVESLQQADPQSVFAKFLMAGSYYELGDEDQATALYKEVVDFNQQDRYYALAREPAKAKLTGSAP